MIEGTTGEFYDTELAEEEVSGAVLKLKLVEPETADTTLIGVTSNLDDRDYNKGCPDVGENEIYWRTIDEELTLFGLPNGKYELSEPYCPEGHQPIDNTTIYINDGIIKSDNPDYIIPSDKSEWGNASVTAIDELFRVTVRNIIKTSDSEEIPVVGAKFRLTGVCDGESVDMSKIHIKNQNYYQENGDTIQADRIGASLAPYKLNINDIENISADKTAAFEFYSTGDTIVISGIPWGQYTLQEIETPLGMIPASPKTFMVTYDENGRLFLDSDSDEENTLTLYYSINDIRITKTDLDNSIINGAVFELSRSDGKTFDSVSVMTEAEKDKIKKRIKAFVSEGYDMEDNNDTVS